MKDLEQWVCWRSEARDGKPTKVPYSPRSGSRARSDDPDTWATLAEAEAAADKDDYHGMGFVFTARDPFCGVDIDSCVNPETAQTEAWATKIVEELDSYTEFSPSGTGLHVIVKAKLPPGGNRKGRVEIYDKGRFFTVTRRHLPGTSRRIEERQEEIEALHARLFLPEQQHAPTKSPSTNGDDASEGLSDAAVLRRAMSSRSGERFAKLWAGDRSGYASDSEADLALCSMLAFWVGDDQERIASFFARSGLNREKWNREDYRRLTISRAIKGTTEFYSSRTSGEAPSRNGHPPNPEASGLAGAIPESGPHATRSYRVPGRGYARPMPAPRGGSDCIARLRPRARRPADARGALLGNRGLARHRDQGRLAGGRDPLPRRGRLPRRHEDPGREGRQEAGLRQAARPGESYAEDKEDWKREFREWEVERRDAARRPGNPPPKNPSLPPWSAASPPTRP